MKKGNIAMAIVAVASIIGVTKYIKNNNTLPNNFEGRYEMDYATLVINGTSGELREHTGSADSIVQKLKTTYDEKIKALHLEIENGEKLGILRFNKNNEVVFYNYQSGNSYTFYSPSKDKVGA